MGMGGGTILIPALILFAHIDPKIAQSVNLLSSIPMTIFALIIHIKNKNVVFSLVYTNSSIWYFRRNMRLFCS